jgi:hypothetical protein
VPEKGSKTLNLGVLGGLKVGGHGGVKKHVFLDPQKGGLKKGKFCNFAGFARSKPYVFLGSYPVSGTSGIPWIGVLARISPSCY